MNKIKELSPWEKTCMRRIKQLIDDYCDGSQQRFVEKTGLNKGSVSQYVNGKNIPSASNANKIAEAFDVDPQWIMGYDIIPPGIDESYKLQEYTINQEAMELYEQYQNLTPENQIAFRTLLKSLQSDS